MFIKVLLIADVALTAALTLIHYFKPSFQYTAQVQAVENEVKALEGSPAAPAAPSPAPKA